MSDPVLGFLQGGWQPQSGTKSGGRISFSARTEAHPNVWNRPLPASLNLAQANLSQYEADQKELVAALQNVPDAMEQLIQGQPRGQVSFATGQGLTGEQQELLDGLRWVNRAARQPVSFAAGQQPDARWSQWASSWKEFYGLMIQAERLVSYMAWIDTDLGHIRVAHSVVSWSGDTRTEWTTQITKDQARIHQRELTLALSNRQLLVQIVTLTAQSAAKLSATLSIPGGGLLAIPQVWQYMRRMIELLHKPPN